MPKVRTLLLARGTDYRRSRTVGARVRVRSTILLLVHSIMPELSLVQYALDVFLFFEKMPKRSRGFIN